MSIVNRIRLELETFFDIFYTFNTLYNEGGRRLKNETVNDALKSAFEAYYQSIERYCKVRLDDARSATSDCVQETFLVYYNCLKKGEKISHPQAFLFKTAGIIVSKTKREYYKKLERTKPLDEAESIPVNLNDFIVDETDYDEIKERLLADLNDNEQELYDLRYNRQKPIKEIAQLLAVSPPVIAN